MSRRNFRVAYRANKGTYDEMIAPLNAGKYQVIFAVVTHKDKAGKSKICRFSRASALCAI